MTIYALKRCLIGIALLWVTVTLVFIAIHTVPGDPARIVLAGQGSGSEIDPAALAETRARLGLDRPILLQYFSYLLGVVTLDLGSSFRNGTPVLELLAERLPNTLELVGTAVLVALIVGVLIGILAAKPKGALAQFLSTLTSIGVSLPVYVTGTVLVFAFAVSLQILPAGGFVSWSDDPAKHFSLLVLPTIAIAVGLSSVIARVTKSAILETQEHDFVRTAHSLGLAPGRAFRTAVLRNSLVPVVTIVGLELGTLLGSTVIIERVFNWPGLSALLVDAVTNRDYPIVQGVVLLTAALFIIVNIIVDVLYGVLNPRVRQVA
ncbi:MAG: ABC transporter permease [Leucobacter sp.]